MIRAILAHCTVADLARAEGWYTLLFGREPNARPMPGLLEWQLGDNFGVQVWAEPERAGRSSIVLCDTDLDETVVHLTATGIDYEGPQPGGGARILQLTDPDGNRVVFTGP
jgi:catechol 2,3-dioxygenase-like lactoylglutathione lyase family enzyme